MGRSRGVHVWTFLGSGVLLALVALFAYAPIFAVDCFWNLKLGQVIVERGAIPTQDLFSAVHPERPYVQFQWLWDVLAFAAQRAGGLGGVRLFMVASMVSSFLVLGWAAWRSLGSRALAFAFCALALVLFEDRFQTRPSATALGFVAAFLPTWLGVRWLRPRAELAYVFVLSCVWSNIHGGEALLSSLGLGALALGDQRSRWSRHATAEAPETRKRSLMLLAAAVVGSLSSPTFVAGLRDWTWAIQPQLATGNKEWLPTYTMLENGVTPSFVLIALGPTALMVAYALEQIRAVRMRASLPLPLAEWILCAGMFALSQQAVRNAFLCIVPLAFMLRRTRPRLTERAARLVAAAAGCLLVVAFDDHVLQGYGGIADAQAIISEDLAPGSFPSELSDFMREAKIEGGIFNDPRWGGYLIWRLWPENHVFVDSRQDLTREMWPLFLAAQSAGSRPHAMETAFSRWGIGLAAFRGPTFPAVRPGRDWQLLYKAGDQELYQRLGARDAAQNLARARAYLEKHASDKSAPLEALAVQVGSRRWLAAPYQQFRARKAEALLASSLGEEAAEGLRLKASLWFEAGLYAPALGALETLLRHDPNNIKAAYQAALAALALEDAARAKLWLKRLSENKDGLSPQQRNRLRAINPADFF